MNALIIDTSGWISYFAGNGWEGIEAALAASRVFLPPVVAAELLSGRMTPAQRQTLQSMLEDLFLCSTDLTHWFRVGELRGKLLGKGLSVSTPDAHIAQCALDLNAELLSEDRIFERIAAHVPLEIVA